MAEIQTNQNQKNKDGFSTRTVHNVLWRFFSGGWRAILTLTTTPFIVRGLGEETYGIMALVLSFVGYFVVLDLDLGTAVTKYVAEYKVKGDGISIKKVVETSLFIYIIIGIIVGIVLLASADLLVTKVIKISLSNKNVARYSLYLLGLSFVFNMPTLIYGAVLQAYHRFDLLSKFSLGFSSVTALGTVLVVALDFGLIPILWLNVLVTLLTLVTYAYFAKRVCPVIGFRPLFDRFTAKRIFSFSTVTLMGKLLSSVYSRVDRLLIGAMVSAAAITYYQVAYVPILMMLRLVAVFQNVTLPMASEFHGGNQSERLRVLYLRGSKLSFIMSLAFGIPLFVFSHSLLNLWMGPTFAEQGTSTLCVLVIWQIATTLSGIALTISLGITRPWFPTTFIAGMVMTSAPIFLLLIPRLGIVGAALGLTIPNVVLYPILLVKINKILGVKNWSFLSAVVGRPLMSALLTSGVSWILMRPWVHSVFELAIGGAGCLVLFYLLLMLMGSISPEDKETFCTAVLGRLQGSMKVAS